MMSGEYCLERKKNNTVGLKSNNSPDDVMAWHAGLFELGVNNEFDDPATFESNEAKLEKSVMKTLIVDYYWSRWLQI